MSLGLAMHMRASGGRKQRVRQGAERQGAEEKLET